MSKDIMGFFLIVWIAYLSNTFPERVILENIELQG